MIYDISDYFGRVRVRGATRQDFVQRMSSGDVLKLKPGQGATTCFTTPIGRIVDYTHALCEDDSLLLLTGGGNQDKLIRWLRKYVFFNDDVQLIDETPITQMRALFDEPLPEALRDAPLHSHIRVDGVLWVKARLGAVDGVFAVYSADGPVSLATPGASFDALRIAAGLPRFPNELGEDYIPLEAGVWDAVSFSKGCYIGQEIIARMESRNQIAKRLMRLDVVSGAPEPGADLRFGNDAAGKLTSVAGAHALGYVRSVVAENGRVLETAAGQVKILAPVHLK